MFGIVRIFVKVFFCAFCIEIFILHGWCSLSLLLINYQHKLHLYPFEILISN